MLLSNVGSHVETFNAIVNELVKTPNNVFCDYLLVDMVGWNSWDSVQKPDNGMGKRIQLSPYDFGFVSPQLLKKDRKQLIDSSMVILEKHSVNLLLTLTDTEHPNWGLIQAANIMGIPSLFIQEGPRPRRNIGYLQNQNFTVNTSISKVLLRKTQTLIKSIQNKTLIQKIAPKLSPNYASFDLVNPYGCGGASVVAVPSDYYAKHYETLQSPSSIKVVGIPRFDKLARYSRCKYLEASSRRERQNNNHKILVVSQPASRYGELTEENHVDNYRSIFAGLSELAKELQIDVIFRLHPSDQTEDANLILKDISIHVTLQTAEPDISDVLPDFDLVIGCTSTTLIEALIVGIPVISWQKHIPTPGSFLTDLEVPTVFDVDQLNQAIREIFIGHVYHVSHSALINECGVLDGQASSRVAKLCLDLIKNAPSVLDKQA